jgi:hypothetical protein
MVNTTFVNYKHLRRGCWAPNCFAITSSKAKLLTTSGTEGGLTAMGRGMSPHPIPNANGGEAPTDVIVAG